MSSDLFLAPDFLLHSTWVLTVEDILEPPKRLSEECAKAGIEDGAFRVCDIGETLLF